MDYSQAIAWLYNLIDYAKPVVYDRVKLQRMETLLTKLGQPQLKLPFPVVIAGTKGKGSTAALLQALLSAAGLKVGLYSKPHLYDYRERFRIGNKLIRRTELAELLNQLKPIIESFTTHPFGIPSYFEVSVALAYLWFIHSKVDIALLEAGIGGRLDAVHTAPAQQVLFTPISYDHTHLLGKTLKAIAREKGDLIPNCGTAFTAPQRPTVLKILKSLARARGTELIEANKKIKIQILEPTVQGTYFAAQTPHTFYPELFLPLLGEHQLDNFALALAAYEAFSQVLHFELSPAKVRQALAKLDWRGRIEILREKPWVILDVAHNPASMAALTQTMRKTFKYQRVLLILGLLQDKDAPSILKALQPLQPFLIATQPRHPKSLSAAALANHAAKLKQDFKGIKIIPNPQEALHFAFKQAQGKDIIVITGSFYLAAELRTAVSGLEI
jgi:dihydrofolate synthase/folylpolyglutamate synthase